MAKVISLDLEMNGGSGKIIQIGYVIFDIVKNKELVRRCLVVDPGEPLAIIPNIGIHITDYTGITEVDIKFNGRSLEDAYKQLVDDVKTYNPTRTCVQWGDGKGDNKGDHDYLRHELGLSWVEFIFRPRAWDVKSLFQIHMCFRNDGVAMGLGKALEKLDMKFMGRQHNAMDDAYNTLRLFLELGNKTVKYDKIVKVCE
jgi:inhibitor of KinA sporulation pathway (predicted exonuclease)